LSLRDAVIICSMFHADLHVHSKYSLATSRECDLEHLAFWAGRKGIAVLGAGDFTHPAWFEELRRKLIPAEPGLYCLRPGAGKKVAQRAHSSFSPHPNPLPKGEGTYVGCVKHTVCNDSGAFHAPYFMLQAEISTVYKKSGRTRKVHHVVYAPDFARAKRLIKKIGQFAKLESDGRPTLGIDSRDLLEIVLGSGEDCHLIPAHIWTPWFGVLGSKSGFDSIKECYGDLAENIFAVETGLSADPATNWRVSSLDRFRSVSNSDAHSPAKLGREATIFDVKMDYFEMFRAMKTGNGFLGTVEFFPEEGRYHHDGHRKCGVCLAPEETRRIGGKCPACGKPLTLGVMHRVNLLADRPLPGPHPNPLPKGEGTDVGCVKRTDHTVGCVKHTPKNAKFSGNNISGAFHAPYKIDSGAFHAPYTTDSGNSGAFHAPYTSDYKCPGPRVAPFRSLIPLEEILSEINRVGPQSKLVKRNYENLLAELGPELFILEKAPLEEISKKGSSLLAEAISRMRAGRVIRRPGFDGRYGTIRLFNDDEA
jgi:PHP family Zn ribbon phosphoesterase